MDEDLDGMSREELVAEVRRLRQGIRGTISPPLTVVPELGGDLIRAVEEGRGIQR